MDSVKFLDISMTAIDYKSKNDQELKYKFP